MPRFADALNEQIAYEFAASQQYIAIAVHYDAQTLPQLAAHFYRQSLEERNHAMMMVQYLLDADEPVVVPAVEAPQDVVRRRRRARAARARPGEARHGPDPAARADRPRGGRPRRRAVHALVPAGAARGGRRRCRRCSTSSTRSKDNVMHVEDFLARESGGENPLEAGAPPAAGGAL